MKKSINVSLLIILIIIGGLIGSFLGDLLKQYSNFFAISKEIGIKQFTIDLQFLKFTFGFVFNINILSVICILIAIIIYRKW